VVLSLKGPAVDLLPGVPVTACPVCCLIGLVACVTLLCQAPVSGSCACAGGQSPPSLHRSAHPVSPRKGGRSPALRTRVCAPGCLKQEHQGIPKRPLPEE